MYALVRIERLTADEEGDWVLKEIILVSDRSWKVESRCVQGNAIIEAYRQKIDELRRDTRKLVPSPQLETMYKRSVAGLVEECNEVLGDFENSQGRSIFADAYSIEYVVEKVPSI